MLRTAIYSRHPQGSMAARRPSGGAGAAAEFRRKQGTADELVRAAPNLSSSSRRSGKGAAGIASIPLSPLDEAFFVRPMLIPWAFFFKGQLEARPRRQVPVCSPFLSLIDDARSYLSAAVTMVSMQNASDGWQAALCRLFLLRCRDKTPATVTHPAALGCLFRATANAYRTQASRLKTALSLALHKFPLLAGDARPARPRWHSLAS